MKQNYRMTLQYEGTKYNGWQKQGNTPNTIQAKLEAILQKLDGTEAEKREYLRQSIAVQEQILRYGEDWEAITGYKYEPWHFRYVEKELAKEIHDANVPFETWMTGYRVRVLQGILGTGVK